MSHCTQLKPFDRHETRYHRDVTVRDQTACDLMTSLIMEPVLDHMVLPRFRVRGTEFPYLFVVAFPRDRDLLNLHTSSVHTTGGCMFAAQP